MRKSVTFDLDESKAPRGKKYYSVSKYPDRWDFTFSIEHSGGLPSLQKLYHDGKKFAEYINSTVDDLDALDGTSIRFKKVTLRDVMVSAEPHYLVLSVDGAIVYFRPEVPDERDLNNILWSKGWVGQ